MNDIGNTRVLVGRPPERAPRRVPPRIVPLALKLAYRNLLQDRLRFVATVIGIVFSIVLVMIQLGLFLSFEDMVTTMIDHAPSGLWVVAKGTKCFEDPSMLNASDRTQALKVAGVASAVPVVIGFASWSVPGGGTTPVFVVGSDPDQPGLHPWHIVKGAEHDLSDADTVAVDRTYFDRLGVTNVGDKTDIRGKPARIAAVTSGIRSFTTTPYVFATLAHAQGYTFMPPDKISYLLVRVSPGTDIATVRQTLQNSLSGVEVLTTAQFRTRSRNFWLLGTGAGAALFIGALLGAVVGTVIIAQTLYASTKDHLSEFATLRAMGSSNLYIYRVIVGQALFSALIGFGIAAAIGLAVVTATTDTALPILMTPLLTAALFLLTVLMCVTSAMTAIAQVLRIDPVMAFRQ